MTEYFTIGQLAKAADVNVETIRYYERRQLITQPLKPREGYRTYPKPTLARVLFIKRAQALGFTLQEIANLLSLGESNCAEVSELAANKLVSVRTKIDNLRRLEHVLEDLLSKCRTKVSYELKRADVTFEDSETNAERLIEATTNAGYPSTILNAETP